MKNRIITLLCIVCLFTGNEVCRAQVQEVISGVVRNESNEPLDGAIISVPDNPEYTTSSDKDGNSSWRFRREPVWSFVRFRDIGTRQ